MSTAQKLQNIVNQWSSCVDCDDTYPEWADVSRGIIICMECAGVHRGLGTHVSQVRSLTLDVWQSEWVNSMQESNETFNAIYEYHVPNEYIKPTQNSSRDLREKYITTKYVGLDTTSGYLSPLFHRDNDLNQDKDALEPVYDKESEADDDDNGVEITKNGTKPWRDHRQKKGKHPHERRDSGMIVNTGVLHISCISATNLPRGNLSSKKSAYCAFDNGYQCVKTKIIKKNDDPIWENEKLMLSINENECIKVAIYNKNENDMLAHNFLDIRDYQHMENDTHQITDYDMIIAPKYKNNKKYTKNGKKILLNFDAKYHKMSVHNEKGKRASLILENTTIEDHDEIGMKLIEEDDDDEEETLSADDDESSSSPPPEGHPGDTQDIFVLYNGESERDKIQRVRLTDSMSINSHMDMDMEDHAYPMIMHNNNDIDTITYISKLIAFTNGSQDYVDLNGLIDAIKAVLRVNDMETSDVLCSTIDRLNEYIFSERDVRVDEDAINGVNDTIIDGLREMNNSLMNNNVICTHFQDIFVGISDDNKYANKQYLIHNLDLITNDNDRQMDILLIGNLLESSDADNIEYIFNEILKMNDGDCYKLHDVIDLIVDCINNNNIKVKRLSVEILSKFSHDEFIQRSILEYSNEVLRFLSLIDNDAFIHISYNIMLSVTAKHDIMDIYSVHYNVMQRYIAQQLVDDYEQQQYNDDINPILYEIKCENMKQSSYILCESKLIEIIKAHLDEVEQYGVDYHDMLNIAKSKQILNFQIKTQCVLSIQNMFRAFHERRNFLKMMHRNKENKQENDELLSINEALNHQLNEQNKQMQQLKQMIQQLKHDESNTNQVISALKHENLQVKQQCTEQKHIITKQNKKMDKLITEHITDKQQFAIKMSNEMNKLRRQLKISGENEQYLLNVHKQKQNTESLFFGLW